MRNKRKRGSVRLSRLNSLFETWPHRYGGIDEGWRLFQEREDARVRAMAREKFNEIDSDKLAVLTGVQLTKLTYWVSACTRPTGCTVNGH